MNTLVKFNFFKSIDDGDNWAPIPREDVPEDLQTDDVIEKLMDGEAAVYNGAAYIIMKHGRMH